MVSGSFPSKFQLCCRNHCQCGQGSPSILEVISQLFLPGALQIRNENVLHCLIFYFFSLIVSTRCGFCAAKQKILLLLSPLMRPVGWQERHCKSSFHNSCMFMYVRCTYMCIIACAWNAYLGQTYRGHRAREEHMQHALSGCMYIWIMCIQFPLKTIIPGT